MYPWVKKSREGWARVHSESVEVEENDLVSLGPPRQTRERGVQLDITVEETGGLWEDYRDLGKRE